MPPSPCSQQRDLGRVTGAWGQTQLEPRGASAGHCSHMEAQLMSQFPPKKGPLSEGEIGTPAHGEGSHADSQKGNAIYVFLKKYIHIYKFMYIYT